MIDERKADIVIHSGDFVAPFTIDVLKELSCPVYSVYGNCDGERGGLATRFGELPKGSIINQEPFVVQLDKFKIVIMHHPHWIDTFAAVPNTDIIIYGHLHKLHIENRPPWIINSGEIFGLKADPTVVWFDTDKYEPEVIKL